ncbi:MAG: flagellar basal body L-ring protein FlgH [bacterium]|nr:flagellar basal body L-ring protein FlgH [bacterium]
MKTTLQWVALVSVTVMVFANVTIGGSIWAKAACRRVPHVDDTARKIGDILQIVIDERTTIDNESKREMTKEATHDADTSGQLTLPYLISLLNNHNFTSPTTALDMSLSNKREAKNEGTYEQTDAITDDVAVTVTDVLPNGNLVVVGSRDRKYDGDVRTVLVSGVVRPSDITFANTVASDSVAEFKIVFKRSGVEKRYTQQSLFDKVLTWINLF